MPPQRDPCRSGYCVVNSLDTKFGAAYARGELESYHKDGLGQQARLLVEYLRDQGLQGQTLLDVGCGIGALHLELLKAGAASAVGVDASPANIEAARRLAEEMGHAEATRYRVGDFVDLEAEMEIAEIVLLDRVVCCYPDMEALVRASARHARALYGLTYPRRGLWMRVAIWGANTWQALMHSPYRGYYHQLKRIAATLAAEGFAPVYQATAGPWEVAVFRREHNPLEVVEEGGALARRPPLGA